MKLYELNNDIINAIETMDEDVDMNELLSKFSDKAEDICKVISHYESFANAAKEEKERLYSLQKTSENKAKGLKDYLAYNLDQQGIEKMDAGLYKLSFRKSKSVVFTDEDQIPDSFKTMVETIKIDKTEIKNAWKSAAVPGTNVVTNKSLQIK